MFLIIIILYWIFRITKQKIFWDTVAKGAVTEGIEDGLDYLEQEGIRTAVISNLSFSGQGLKYDLISCF